MELGLVVAKGDKIRDYESYFMKEESTILICDDRCLIDEVAVIFSGRREGVNFISLRDVTVEETYGNVSEDGTEVGDGASEAFAIPIMEDDGRAGVTGVVFCHDDMAFGDEGDGLSLVKGDS